LYALVCVAMLHFARSFVLMVEDLAAFKEMKANAPADWSFSSAEEQDEEDAADWWKVVD
jgi:hypothetical protein